MHPSRRTLLHSIALSFFLAFASLPSCAGTQEQRTHKRSSLAKAGKSARSASKLTKRQKRVKKARKHKPRLAKRSAKKSKKLSKSYRHRSHHQRSGNYQARAG